MDDELSHKEFDEALTSSRLAPPAVASNAAPVHAKPVPRAIEMAPISMAPQLQYINIDMYDDVRGGYKQVVAGEIEKLVNEFDERWGPLQQIVEEPDGLIEEFFERWCKYGQDLGSWDSLRVHLIYWDDVWTHAFQGEQLRHLKRGGYETGWSTWLFKVGGTVNVEPAPDAGPTPPGPTPPGPSPPGPTPGPASDSGPAPTKRLELLIRVGATGSSGLVRVRGHVKSMQAIVIGEKLLKAPRVYPRLT